MSEDKCPTCGGSACCCYDRDGNLSVWAKDCIQKNYKHYMPKSDHSPPDAGEFEKPEVRAMTQTEQIEHWAQSIVDTAYKMADLLERQAKQIQLMHDNGLGESWVEKFQAGLYDLEAENRDLKAEVDRLSKRDCNATIELCYDDGNNPFAREELRIIDVGVSDNVYIVESKVLNDLKAENAKLKAELEKKE